MRKILADNHENVQLEKEDIGYVTQLKQQKCVKGDIAVLKHSAQPSCCLAVYWYICTSLHSMLCQDVRSTFPWQITIDFEDTKDDSCQQWTLTLDTHSSARRFVAAVRKAFRKLWTIELEVNCPPGSDLLQ